MIQESFMQGIMRIFIRRIAGTVTAFQGPAPKGLAPKGLARQGLAKPLVRGLALGLACAVFTGCIGTNPATPTRFYLLTPAAYEAPLVTGADHADEAVIEIQALRLPQYLEKPQIVTRSAKNRLELAEYEQWGGNLRKNMVRVMRQNLSFLLSTPHVARAPFASPSPSGYRITAEVMAFEADAAGLVTLDVHWRLSDRASGRLAAARMSTFEREAQSLDMDRIVEAMGAVMGAFCLEVGEAVRADMGRED